MASEKNPARPARAPDPADEIEILEVVGLDEDGVPLDDVEGTDPDDIEVVFEEAVAAVEDVGGRAAVPTKPPQDAHLKERLVRLQADFENFKKRIERERLDHLRQATSELVLRLLPVLDNLERALASARPAAGAEAITEGVALIQRQLLAELDKEGLKPMESVGEPFDPLRHEAVATGVSATVPNTVTEEFQRGYFFHGRVLRPAMVRVSVEPSDDAIADGGKESSHG